MNGPFVHCVATERSEGTGLEFRAHWEQEVGLSVKVFGAWAGAVHG